MSTTDPKYISPKAASDIAKGMGIKMSIPWVIKQVYNHNLGYQLTGKFGNWRINKKKFIAWLESRIPDGTQDTEPQEDV